MKRMLVGMLLGVLFTSTIIGGYIAIEGNATAQNEGTWQLAGGDQGFAIEEWGTGQGVDVSLDEWIESMPDSCHIQLIDRGVSFKSAMYRCPD